MTRILIGVLATMGLALGLQTMRLDTASKTADRATKDLDRTRGYLEAQIVQSGAAHERYERLDARLVELNSTLQANELLLQGALSALENFQPQPGDSDETVQCARLAVPADIDRIMRQ